MIAKILEMLVSVGYFIPYGQRELFSLIVLKSMYVRGCFSYFLSFEMVINVICLYSMFSSPRTC